MTRTLTGRHVLATMIAFFGVIFAVNGYFLVSALKTHTGVVSVEPYRKGLAYNERIAASDAQDALGWRETVVAGRDGTVVGALCGPDQAPIRGATVSGVLGRPSTGSHDKPIAFVERAPGEYQTVSAPLAPGTWLLEFHARHGEAVDYRARRRLWLPE